MNHLGHYKKPTADYFFSKAGSIWGFAIWKRTFNLLEPDLSYTTDKYALKLIKEACPKANQNHFLIESKRQRDKTLTTGKIVSFEMLTGASFFLSNGLLIIPKKNLISCIGISENSGHSVNHPKKLPRATRNLFYMATYNLDFPLVHPKYYSPDIEYEKMVYKRLGLGSVITFFRKVEGKLRRMVFDALHLR